MECYVRISSQGKQLLTPSSLTIFAAQNPILPLTINGASGDFIDLTFSRVRHSSPRSSTSPSSYSSDCHFEEEADGILNTLTVCTPSSISGVISTGRNYFILDVKNATDFILLPQSLDSCELSTRFKREGKTNKSTLPGYYSEYNDGKWRYVELALVADYSVYAKYDKDEAKVMERLQTIAHHVNALYYPLNIRVTLVWVDIWKDGDKFEVATSGDRTLDRFLNYRKEIIKAHPNDNAHMLTDIRFEANVVGKAFKGTMCSYDYSGGVDVDHSDNPAVVAATVAHEMGHNFGMEHDVDYGTICSCPGNHCVMAPSTGTSPPSFWSDCSLRYLYSSFNRGVDLCLKNPPEKNVGGAKCGNGIVEPGEECDCGREQCSHSCCDGTTCRLTGNAECADGDCCDLLTCKPKPRATLCRSAVGICDLPEFCNGDTADCPADFFIQNGDVCPGRKDEYCYEGQCGSRPDQCVSIWGPTGKEGDRACYQQNTNGIIQGNCGFDVHTRQFTRCLADDIMCGRLQCGTQAERPVFGDPTTVTSAYTYVRVGTETHQCHVIKTTYIVGQKNKPDPGMVLDGAECGDHKICVNAKCKPLSEVSKTVSKCNDHCHYRGILLLSVKLSELNVLMLLCFLSGICNNVGNCHCENGFGGIACEIPGFGGSVNSNPSSTTRGITPSTVFLLLLAICSIAVVLVCFYYWFRKRRNLAGEFWEYTRKTLKLHGVLVPVRKAPPPPKRHMKRESLNAMWGDGGVTYSVNERPPTFMPPAIPLMKINAGNITPSTRSPDQLLPHVPVSANGTNSKPLFTRVPSTRPKEPPPVVPLRPLDSKLEELYKERGEEMGIKRDAANFPSRDLTTPPPEDPTVPMKKGFNRPIQAPPPPPPSQPKLVFNSDKPSRPAIPKKPPKVLSGLEGADVRALAAKFDCQRRAK
ncbi:hypothetical protein RB195_025463 [Necator americanus]|uniref:Disintegrin n=1 Tax=Necator americanus TaxID=51031 RepID=A0ABR1ESF7_NECAM